jgi:septation ring formation regulator EzrA
MGLQEIFYLVAIVTMSLLTILFVVLLVLVFYLKNKIDDLIDALSHPKRIASSVGEAVVDTAIDQVKKFTKGSGRKK